MLKYNVSYIKRTHGKMYETLKENKFYIWASDSKSSSQ